MISCVPGGSSRADGGQRLRVLERQERHGRFRPDHMRDAGEIVVPPRGVAARQVEMILEDARWFSGRHFSRCGTLGCTMRMRALSSMTAGSPDSRQAPRP